MVSVTHLIIGHKTGKKDVCTKGLNYYYTHGSLKVDAL